MINYVGSKIHWNYFIALEEDLQRISRYVEFSNDNGKTYSIEFAHALLSTASEVDVVLRQYCKLLDPTFSGERIDEYRKFLLTESENFSTEIVTIPRFGITLQPWVNWQQGKTPEWWKYYNKVKHERESYFKEANLTNTLNCTAALLVALVYFYRRAMSIESKQAIKFSDTTRSLTGSSGFLMLSDEYYYGQLLI